jgi:transposase
MNVTTYGVDIAKSVFQIHWVEPADGEIHRAKLSRAKFAQFFANRGAARVVMEACGGAHHWARALTALGHQVELLPAHQVRAFVTGNKDDAADARGLWLAAQHHDIRRVAVKSAQQQAELSLHRVRSHWVSVRTATINSLRGLLCEFGVVLAKGRPSFCKRLAEDRAQIDAKLPPLMQRLLDAQLLALRELDKNIALLESELNAVLRSNELARRLERASGIGLMGSTALAATLGDASGWRNAREFACCLGLTPRHTGTGGKVRMGGISKRGDGYLRTVLIHGARNLVRVANPPQWIAQMLRRRPPNVVAVAVANKLARIAWSMAASGNEFDPQRAFGAKAAA